MDTIRAWKVVAKTYDGTLCSCTESRHSVGYFFGSWSYPHATAPNQFLFCFKTKEDAVEFSKRKTDEPSEVHPCEVTNPTPKRNGFTKDGIPFDTSSTYWPRGTMFVSSIKLIA